MRADRPTDMGGLCCRYSGHARAAFSPVLSFNSAGIEPLFRPPSYSAELLQCSQKSLFLMIK